MRFRHPSFFPGVSELLEKLNLFPQGTVAERDPRGVFRFRPEYDILRLHEYLIAGCPHLFGHRVRVVRPERDMAERADVPDPGLVIADLDRKSTRLNSSHPTTSRMPSSA